MLILRSIYYYLGLLEVYQLFQNVSSLFCLVLDNSF